MQKIFVLLLAALFFIAAPTNAQSRFAGKAKFTGTVTPTTIRAGELAKITLTGTIEPGFHIYSVVKVEDGPTPTGVEITGEGVTPEGATVESTPERKFDKNFEKELGFFEKEAKFTQYARLAKTAQPGALPLTVGIKYQACDASGCQPPRTDKIEIAPLTIEAGEARKEYLTANTSIATPTDKTLSGPLWQLILTGFGAGLLALITPCVFPMIPVTLAFFTKQATQKDEHGNTQTDSKAVVKLASVYATGIIVAFTAIGLVLAVTIGAAGANNFAAHPVTNLVFGILFVVFGLAMLEVMEIRPPRFLEDKAGQARQKSGIVGVLLMGITFVITAFTCTAPFIGTVLVAAATGDLSRPIIGMLAFSSALALPFFLLAFFPALLAKMPKSGAWLTTVKGAMGFLELAAATKFFSNTDLIWKWEVITRPMMFGLWAVIAFAAAAWLFGKLEIGFNTPSGKPTIVRATWAALFALCGVYSLYGLTGKPTAPALEAFLPPSEYGGFGGGKSDGLPWLDNLEAGKTLAKTQNKKIFIDFTGHTCSNCRDVEKNVFSRADIQNLLKEYVLVRLYTDDTANPDEVKNQTYQGTKFNSVTLPLYAIIDADENASYQTDWNGAKDVSQFSEMLKKHQ
jgi:thiol:disulfide interchange protein